MKDSITYNYSPVAKDFTKKWDRWWRKKGGHMFGRNMQDEVRKAMGGPNVAGSKKAYKTGQKAGQMRTVKYKKVRAQGKAVLPRVPDTDDIGFRFVGKAKMTIWQVGANDVEMGFLGGEEKAGKPTRDQEEGFYSERTVWKKINEPKKLNRRNVTLKKRAEWRAAWESMPEERSIWGGAANPGNDALINKLRHFYKGWGYTEFPSSKSTYHPTLKLALGRQMKKWPRTVQKMVDEFTDTQININKV